jgi:hypothetical protein
MIEEDDDTWDTQTLVDSVQGKETSSLSTPSPSITKDGEGVDKNDESATKDEEGVDKDDESTMTENSRSNIDANNDPSIEAAKNDLIDMETIRNLLQMQKEINDKQIADKKKQIKELEKQSKRNRLITYKEEKAVIVDAKVTQTESKVLQNQSKCQAETGVDIERKENKRVNKDRSAIDVTVSETANPMNIEIDNIDQISISDCVSSDIMNKQNEVDFNLDADVNGLVDNNDYISVVNSSKIINEDIELNFNLDADQTRHVDINNNMSIMNPSKIINEYKDDAYWHDYECEEENDATPIGTSHVFSAHYLSNELTQGADIHESEESSASLYSIYSIADKDMKINDTIDDEVKSDEFSGIDTFQFRIAQFFMFDLMGFFFK